MSRILISFLFFSVMFTSPAGVADATEKLQELLDPTLEQWK
jgi:hypothetical protein